MNFLNISQENSAFVKFLPPFYSGGCLEQKNFLSTINSSELLKYQEMMWFLGKIPHKSNIKFKSAL